MGRYYTGTQAEIQQKMQTEYTNNIIGRAPAQARALYQQFNQDNRTEDNMNKEQLEEVNAAFNTKLVASMKLIENRIDDFEAKANRPGAGSFEGSEKKSEHLVAFNAALRTGNESALQNISNAMSEGSGTDGGWTIPTTIDTKISEIQINLNPMRRVSDVVKVSTPNFVRLANLRGTASGWVGETAPRPTTASPQFAQLTPFMGELYAVPKVTQQLLNDAGFDLESFLIRNIGEQFAYSEGSAFTNGDGVTKPKGFLTYPSLATLDGVRAFGTMQYVPTGVAADFAATNPADQLFDLVYALKAAHRQGACWMMSKAILDKVRKFKTTTGEYLWTDNTSGDGGIAGAAPGTLLGYPVYENEDMATAVGANAVVAAFGNFKNGYCIVDRMDTRLLRDPYTDRPFVNLYCTKRVGSMLTDSEAIKVLKCSVA